MRNIPKPLDRADSIRQSINARTLQAVPEGKTVHVSYVKRNGEVSSSTGAVAFFNGRIGYDTGSVTIADPVKGNRTINLHRIITIE